MTQFFTNGGGVFGFYGYAGLPVFLLGFSFIALKSICFAVFNNATVNGFLRYLGRFSGWKYVTRTYDSIAPREFFSCVLQHNKTTLSDVIN